MASPAFGCDAITFEQIIEACQHHPHSSVQACPHCQEQLRQAAALYHRGVFLENFPEIDSAAFIEWRRTQRTYFAARFAQVQATLQYKTAPRGNLPTPLPADYCVARATEVTYLAPKLMHPVYRWLTLVGPAGVGKTALALALGEYVQRHFPDGVWFVEFKPPLLASPHEISSSEAVLVGAAPCGRPQGAAPTSTQFDCQNSLGPNTTLPKEFWYGYIAAAISDALGLNGQGTTQTTQHLCAYVSPKEMLLILDRVDLLDDEIDFILQLLQSAPRLRVLATARSRPHLQSQLLYRVEPLPVTKHNMADATRRAAIDASARARSSQRKVEPSYSHADHVSG